jgi:hypothetical protein
LKILTEIKRAYGEQPRKSGRIVQNLARTFALPFANQTAKSFACCCGASGNARFVKQTFVKQTKEPPGRRSEQR